MSQKRNFPQSRLLTSALQHRFFLLRLFRSGNFFQADLPLSYISASSLRPLCSTVITRFSATMGLSDSPQGPVASYLFPLTVSAPAGLPGSSTDLSTRAAPSHPEESGDCFCPLLHRRFQASSTWVDWPLLLFCVTRPKRVRLRCGSRVRFARLRQRSCPRPRLLGYLPNGQSTRYPPFRILDQPGLSWRFPRTQSSESCFPLRSLRLCGRYSELSLRLSPLGSW